MKKEQIQKVNTSLAKTKKAIISLGCSFVQGQGAIDEEIYNNYSWEGPQPGRMHVYWTSLSNTDRKKITNDFSDIKLTLTTPYLDFTEHEYNNSFVSILCNKYFDGNYTPINLGRSGNGNRAAIKELYYYPAIDWNSIEELIIIFCPSGPERFDFIDDRFHELNDHPRWNTMWPRNRQNSTELPDGPRKRLWNAYESAAFSDKFSVLEQIANIQELITWCKLNKAKLIITPAFMRDYTKKEFTDYISTTISRDCELNKTSSKTNRFPLTIESVNEVVSLWPWDNMFCPDNYPTFVDLVMSKETDNWENGPGFFSYSGIGSPNKWITPCAHPSKKGHDLFASYLHKYILKNL